MPMWPRATKAEIVNMVRFEVTRDLHGQRLLIAQTGAVDERASGNHQKLLSSLEVILRSDPPAVRICVDDNIPHHIFACALDPTHMPMGSRLDVGNRFPHRRVTANAVEFGMLTRIESRFGSRRNRG